MPLEQSSTSGRERMRERMRLWATCSAVLLVALLFIYPYMFVRWLKRTLTQREAPSKTASAVAVGVMMSVMPIWGFQMLATIGLAHVLRLNKVVAVAFSNASLPPFIPFIVYASLSIGTAVTGAQAPADLTEAGMGTVADSAVAYAVGAVILGLLLGAATWPVAYGIVRVIRAKGEKGR